MNTTMCGDAGTPQCVGMAMTLGTGACAPMQAQSTRVAASVSAADCDTLIQVQRNLPTATDQCCTDLRAFVEAVRLPTCPTPPMVS